MDAEHLTVDMLWTKPCSQIGKNGWFCYYALFTRRGQFVLAAYCGHRMTNEHYTEIAADGTPIFAWDSWAVSGRLAAMALSIYARTDGPRDVPRARASLLLNEPNL